VPSKTPLSTDLENEKSVYGVQYKLRFFIFQKEKKTWARRKTWRGLFKKISQLDFIPKERYKRKGLATKKLTN